MEVSRERILICMNQFQGYENTIPSRLRILGYDAKWSNARPGNSFAVKVLTRLGLLQKIKSISRKNVARIAAEAREFSASTILLISPENLRAAEIKHLREILPEIRILLYLYDSSTNRYLDQQIIDATDASYSFDMDDCEHFNNLRLIPLFHQHESFDRSDLVKIDHDYDYCFIGTARVRRVRVLADIARKARDKGARFYFYLHAPSLPQYVLSRFFAILYRFDGTLSRQCVPFQTYLNTLANSSCVIDIEQKNQGGLTIRTMDSVFAGRPLATSNANIVRHDFFPHFPISVFSTDTFELDLSISRHSAKAEYFFHKYHIDTWLKTILTGDVPSYRVHGEGLAVTKDMRSLRKQKIRE